jgi:hypothetical protein
MLTKENIGHAPWHRDNDLLVYIEGLMKALKRTIAGGVLTGALLSAVLLVPCFWQPRIEAGDLSSHVYNAWLAQLIERGQAPGLALVRQTNNVLFDLMLGGLMRILGATAAQRVAVSFAVLVFFWGTFAFVWSCARPRRAPWQLVPCLAMLTYGWVFRMGLFNFYIALGLAFGALALARLHRRWAWIAAGMLCMVAYVAHPLPVVWAVGVWLYERVAQAIAPRHRSWIMIAVLASLALTGLWLGATFKTRRGIDQVAATTGAEQLWVYGAPYIVLSLALLAIWIACFARVLSTRGILRTLLDIKFEIWALSAAALVLLPAGVLLPGYRSGLDFLPERMSLAGAVLFCGLLTTVRLPKPLVGMMAIVGLVFFAFSYRDERALNQVETSVEQALVHLPPGRRVVSALEDPESRVQSLVHVIDRACVGRCFSYANYEPCTWQFRVRAQGPNPIVVAEYGDSYNIQTGSYRVKARDLPLYKVDLCAPGKADLCVARLEAGDKLRSSGLRVAGLQGGSKNRHD